MSIRQRHTFIESQTCERASGSQVARDARRPDGASALRMPLLCALLFTTVSFSGQLAAADWDPIARLTLGTIYTDNVRLGTAGQGSDLILTTSPTIGVRGQGGRLRANVIYSPVVRGYVNETREDTLVNNLNGTATLEAVENFLFVDGRARITQTEISPFGGVANDPALLNVNRTESRSVGLSPYIRGRFVGGGQYQLRHNIQYTTFTQGGLSDSITNTTTGNAVGAQGRFVQPSVDYRLATSEFNGTRVSSFNVLRARATFLVDGTFQPFVNAGYEDNQFRFSSISGPVYGAGLQWRPSPRTQVMASVENRFFGTGYMVNASHRMGWSSLRLRASRREQVLPDTLGFTTVDADTRELLDQSLQSRIPDDAQRAQEVDRLIQQGGLDATTEIPLTVVSSRVTVVETISPALAVTRQRTTATFTPIWSRTKAITENQIAGFQDPFATGNEVERMGFNVAVSHRVTPITSLSGSVAYNETFSKSTVAGQPDRRSEQTIYRLNVSTRIGPRTSLSGGVRFQTFSSNTGPGFEERALIANLTHSFF